MTYISYSGRQATGVKCKGCEAVLIENRCQTPLYCGMLIAMREPNGLLSKHETPMCKDCKKRFISEGAKPGELEKLYAEDIEAWIETALRAGHSAMVTYKMAERQALRTPLRILDEQGSFGE